MRDAEALFEIERVSFSDPWTKDAFEDTLATDSTRYFLASCGDAPAGYAGYISALDESDIINIAVLPKYRKMGLGDALLSVLLSDARQSGIKKTALEVRRSNAAAIALYKKHGFVAVGERRAYYKNPTEDAVIMVLEL